MSELSAQAINELFIQKLDTDREKFAANAAAYIRVKLREVSFARKIIPPVYITKADCQRSLQHDQLVKIVDIEPDSKAMAVNFRGAGDMTYVEGKRFEIAFYKIESDTFEKAEVELLAYEMPITTIIENNTVKDIQAIEDAGFMSRVEAALVVEGSAKKPTAIDTGGLEYPTAEVFASLFNALEGINDDNSNYRPLKTDTILMSNSDWNSLINLPSTTIGSNLAGEITVNGYKYPTLFGKKVIVTSRKNLVQPGYIYAFAEPAFLGHFFILNDTKFWIEKKKDIISWVAWEHVGMGFGNTHSIACQRWNS